MGRKLQDVICNLQDQTCRLLTIGLVLWSSAVRSCGMHPAFRPAAFIYDQRAAGALLFVRLCVLPAIRLHCLRNVFADVPHAETSQRMLELRSTADGSDNVSG
jgi:hypothetical protein